MNDRQAKILAMAMYELRLLLVDGLGSKNDAPHELRLASHLAYALHNDALAVMEGKGFDPEAALTRIANIDRVIGGTDGQRISGEIRSAIAGPGGTQDSN